MTKKKAIKILMAASRRGNRSDANILFEAMRTQMKKYPKDNPSNMDVARRVLKFIMWCEKNGIISPVDGAMAAMQAAIMEIKYGEM